MFNTLPAPSRTRRGTSVFRLGPSVPDGAVNLAFVQSIPMDIQENLQAAYMGHLIPDNLLAPFADMIATQNVLATESFNVVLTDTVVVGGVAARWSTQDEEALVKYKAYSVWYHIESNPQVGASIKEHKNGAFMLSPDNAADWDLYQGNNIELLMEDGSFAQANHAIYIKQYESAGIRLSNCWRVMVYVEDFDPDAPIVLVYDKGEIHGVAIADVTGYEQRYGEVITPIPVIPESNAAYWRTWQCSSDQTKLTVTYGTAEVPDSRVGKIGVYFEDTAKIDVRVPTTADNHLAWNLDIKKGRMMRKIQMTSTNASLIQENGKRLSPSAQVKLQNLIEQMGSMTDPYLEIYYSTDEYSRRRQGNMASQLMAYAPGMAGIIDEAVVTLPYEPYPGMPIIIFVTEDFGDPDTEKTWVVTNMGDSWDAIQAELRRHGATWYSGQNISPPLFIPRDNIFPVTYVDGDRVHFDNTLYSSSGTFKKWFTTLAFPKAFFYYRNDYVPFTGYWKGNIFCCANLNPSLGHYFSGQIQKSLQYDQNRGVWESGVAALEGTDVHLYDVTTQSLTETNGMSTEISSSLWAAKPKTDLSVGEFEIENFAGDKKVMLICTAYRIPGYNLFTTPVLVKMYPYRIAIRDGVNYKYTPINESVEKIQFDNKMSGGNIDAIPLEVILLAVVNVVPNTIYGQNIVFDTRSPGGGLQESVEPVAGERHFWDIGNMDGRPYTGNQVVVLEVPISMKRQFLDKEMTEDQIETMIQNKMRKYVAKGTVLMIEYV